MSKIKIIELDDEQPPPIARPLAPAPASRRFDPSGKSVYVAVPAFGCLVHNAFMSSLLMFNIEAAKRGLPVYVDMLGNESLVQRARNILLARFKKSPATHILFIDSDIAFQPETVFRALEFDKPCVSCAYPKKMIDFDRVVAKVTEKDPEAVQSIHSCGLDYNINIAESVKASRDGFIPVLDAATGFLLIKRGLVEALERKFSDLTVVNDIISSRDDVPTYVDLFECIRDPVDDKGNKRLLSEDYSFSRKVQQLGERVYMDIASVIAHNGNMMFSGDIRDRMRKTVKYELS